MRLLKPALSIFLSALYCACFGQHTTHAHVAYFKTSTNDYSQYYYREIVIVPGLILQSRTKDTRYDANSDYVLIWYNQDEVSVVELMKDFFDFGQRLFTDELDDMLFTTLMWGKEKTWIGYDEDKTRWRICFADQFQHYSCETGKDGLSYLFEGIDQIDLLIDEYNKIVDSYNSDNLLLGCEYYESKLDQIEKEAIALKARLNYDDFTGNDPYWELYLNFLGTCTDLENSSKELKSSICE